MVATVKQEYPLAALFIHATKQEVTKDRMKAVFETLGLEFSPKIASLYEMSADKYASIISNIGGSSAAPAESTGGNAAPAKEAEPVKEESSSAEIDFNF